MRWCLAMVLWLFPLAAMAQGTATLVADSVTVEGRNRLIAIGNVEVLYDGTRLSAAAVTFDRDRDRLEITGPIIIRSADGMILTATSATLDPRLQNGLLRSARLVLDQQLQLAAYQIDRSEGRYSQLYKVVATSCQVCGTQAPLWEIRAERVVHDEEAQQLYFTNAVLRLRGVPVFWLPQMRLPDPSLARATGFLIPSLRTTDQLGTGLKLPYFFTLGDSRDVTVTPYLSAKTTTVETRFRQAFASGDLELNAAASRDTLTNDGLRAYLFAQGAFDLGRDYKLTFGYETASDRSYLLDYGYSSKDRLESDVTLTRVRQNDLLVAGLTYYQSLRADEPNSSLPPVVANFDYERRISAPTGGTLTLDASADTLARTGTGTGDNGRDVTRLGFGAHYDQRWISAGGLVADMQAGIDLDSYRINNDPAFDTQTQRAVPTAGIVLRYPLARQGIAARHLLVPAIAVVWSETLGITPPNEDSTRPEFDQANLLTGERFPGDDATETGLRAAAGLTWTRIGARGVTSTLTFGRLARVTPSADFTPATGLDGTISDWLVAGQVVLRDGVSVTARSLLNDDFSADLTAGRIAWTTDDVKLSAAYIWQIADPARDRPEPVSEWSLDTFVQVTDTWALSVDARYDIARDRPAKAGLGLQWRNECMTVDLSVSRRYTTSTSVAASTDFGLAVTLNGFSTGRTSSAPAARCNS
jgi:LPS-assembly protein